MTRPAVIAGIDVGNATTEIALVCAGSLLAVDRAPTRGRKGSPESLRGAAALARRVERRLGRPIDEARIAPLRAVDTATIAVPPAPARTGRLRLVAAGVPTPGGGGVCVGRPLWLDRLEREAPGLPGPVRGPASGPVVVIVPPGFGYARAAGRLRNLLAAGTPVGAVLAAGDEGVLIANRIGAPLPVIDQVDTGILTGCLLLAVEARPPGQPLTLLSDPIAVAAAFSLAEDERRGATALCRSLLDYSNAVVGLESAAAPRPGDGDPDEPQVLVGCQQIPLRAALADAAGWPVGAVSALRTGGVVAEVDDLFAVDLGLAGDAATARRGSLGRSALVASLARTPNGLDHAALLAGLLDRPVRCLLTEPAAARLGALTTPGARPDALVVDIGAGTIDLIAPPPESARPESARLGPAVPGSARLGSDRLEPARPGLAAGVEVVAAGAGDMLTAAVAETLGIPKAAADWVKRGPCLRVDGGQRFEAEDGSRRFLDRPAPPAAVGMLAVNGPAGLLPFDRRHSPGEWRAIRLRLKEAVFAVNVRRALGVLGGLGSPGTGTRQILIVGGPAGDDELLGVLMRALPPDVAVGRGNVGADMGGPAAGHRYAAALGLALAPADT